MRSTLENVEESPGRHVVKLSVTIDEAEFDRAIDQAFRKIAHEVRLPGFRAGKVPRKVLEARIGLAPAREQALRDAIPNYLASAVREHDIDLVATPQVEIRNGAESGPVELDATCEVRPEITVPGYGGLRVELPSLTVDDDDVEQAIDAERQRHGALVDVDRPVQSGDYVTLTLQGTRDGEPVAGLNTEDWLYEVGKGWVAPGFDNELIGASAGAELRFIATPNGTDEPADFEVTVQKVQEMVLPELTDEWVEENVAEHESVDAYRASVRDRLAIGKLNQARSQVVERTTSALAELVEIEPPDAMVQSDLQSRVQTTAQQFQSQGIAIEQWLQATGQSPEAFMDMLRTQSVKASKVDLALRAVAAAEAIDVDDADLEREFAQMAMRYGQKASAVRRAYESNDAIADLTAQIRKSKALDWLLHNVDFVDGEGNPLDRDTVLGHSHDDHGDEHDHGHGDEHDHGALHSSDSDHPSDSAHHEDDAADHD